MQSDIVLLMYHGIDWHFPPARQQYLARAFAKYCRVVYLDGGRDGRFKISSYQPQDNVTVIRGLVAFLSTLRRRRLIFGLRNITRALLRPYLKDHDTVILWTMGANMFLRSLLPCDLMVFDCMDPCFEDDPRVQAQFDHEEKEALSKADIVFASAWSLLDKCQMQHPHAYLLNNACAPEDYTAELIASTPCPEWWPHTRLPIAAYLGTFGLAFRL